ncbi:glycosyltransferase family 2 protein [bacterium]|nr:glycosyltransferase family 2 protein [bacterium]
MQNISVVIPTLQKNKLVLNKLLELLLRDTVVGEVILINNAQKPFTLHSSIQKNKKLKILNQQKNIYVNKSWNLGINNCKNDIFLIINDDILPCENFCSKIINSGILDKEDTGLVGIHSPDIVLYETDTKDIDIPVCNPNRNLSFVKIPKYFGLNDWGSAFFGKKENYYKIPPEIKIIFGDNYLLYKNMENGKTNYQLCGLPFNHIHSLSSSSKEFERDILSDLTNYKKYFPKEDIID